MTRIFTLPEANALLPQLRGLLTQAREEREKMLSLSPALAGAREGYLFDWGSPSGPEYIQVLDGYYRISREIENLGVMVKDYEKGLCDFPHFRDGRIVYLCWKLDEAEVGWWHEQDAGFAGRQPI
jgi:hypothetical protein